MTDVGVSAAAAGATAAVMHAVGLDPYVLAVATVGAVFLQAWSDKSISRWRAIWQVVCSGLVGAFLAQGISDYSTINSRAAVMALAAFCGFCAFDLFASLAKQGDSIVETLLGKWRGPK